ncbi:uncharacterized protein LOC141589876 [Silene latifolia]|uniref:uncharacterized protein LOC141589876 n=1 Tax=Silene latifolia TaxID=37657 RepID=UPI003D76C50D
MVWNVQGTGNKKKINANKEVVRIYKPTVLAGGIWLYWRKDVVTVTPIAEHQQFITVEISRNGELPWFFSAVYASLDPANRRQLWVELENFARHNNRPWLLAGDFNETRSLRERHGRDHNMARRCENFDNWIENCEFLELAFTGPSHTRARGNSVGTRQSARLDRALCNAYWGALFEDAMVRHVPIIQSDHCALFISPNGFVPLNAINRPFRFQACWLTHENFKEFVDESWPEEGIFTARLETLSQKLQTWNAEIFGNIFKQKKTLLACIEGCQRSLSLGRKSNLIKLEAKLRRELDEILAKEELLWYQKSRMEFIKDGDRNTTYFHVSTLVRRWRNRITSLKDANGEWTDDSLVVKGIVVNYFKNLYTDEPTEGTYDLLPWDLFQEFNTRDWEWLTKPFTIA